MSQYCKVSIDQLKPLGTKALLVVLVIIPHVLLVLGMDFELNFVCGLMIWGLLAMSLDVVWGYAGIISLGQGMFFGIGAYTMGYMLIRANGLYAPILGVFVGVPLALILALALGFVSFRSRVGGLFFAVITLASTIVLQLVAMTWKHVTGGDNGIIGIPRLGLLGPRGDLLQYYVILAVTLLAYLICRRSMNSHFGRVLTSIRENELRAMSIGYNVDVIKTLTFGISSIVAAVAGAIFATYNGIVTPSLVGFETAANVLIWVAIGGRGHLIGAFVGTFLIQSVRMYMTGVLGLFMSSGQAMSVWLLFFGLVFLFIILFYPNGLMGLLMRIGPLQVRIPSSLAILVGVRSGVNKWSKDEVRR